MEKSIEISLKDISASTREKEYRKIEPESRGHSSGILKNKGNKMV